jgi:predicted MFS family arabinose efflux permease
VNESQRANFLELSDTPTSKRELQIQFWALAIATMLFNVGASIFFLLYNLFMLDLGVREQSLGILTGAMALGSMAGTIPIGMLARRVGIKKVLIVCLLLVAGAFCARVFLLQYSMQVAFAFLDGVMLCGWVVCLAPAVASVVEERKRPFAFSILFAIAIGSGSLGGLVGGHLPVWCQSLGLRYAGVVISATEGKRLTLLAAGVITGLAAWPITRLRSNVPAQQTRWIQRPSPFLGRFLLAGACWAAAVGAFNPFANVFFVRYLGVSVPHLGNFFSIAQILQAGPVLLMPIIVRRTGLVFGIVASQLTAAVAIAFLAIGHGVLRAEVVYCVFMSAQHMCDPGFQSLLMDRVSVEERSNAAALYFLVISIAQACAAGVAGMAFARYRFGYVLIGVAVAAAVAALVFRVLCAPYGATEQKQEAT